jgi:acyl-CoA thioesterase-1
MFRFTCFVLLSFVSTIALSQDSTKAKAKAKREPSPVLAQIEDQPGLPRVLLIGDSISMGYTLPTRELLKGKANVHRIPTNGGPTTRGLAEIEKWLGDKKWDVIHFNWGLHDLKYINETSDRVDPSKGKIQVPPADYEANLRKLTQRLKQTGAKLIWCSTTPVPEGSDGRIAGDDVKYNAIAAKIMAEEGVTINDLWSFAEPQMAKIALPDGNVHYTPEGSNLLATKVVEAINAAMK